MRENLPIIILGCPRSGTTLMRRLLNAHPNIDCPGESFVLRGAVRFLSSEKVAEGIDYGPLGGLGALGFETDDVKARLRKMVLSFHEELAAQSNKQCCAIKTAVDSFYLPQIVDLFAGHARFVFLVRHGADVAVSMREFMDAMEGPIEEFMPFIERNRRIMPSLAEAWAKVTSDMLDAAEVNSDEIFALRYEDLVSEPTEVLGELFEFLAQPCEVDDLLTKAFSKSEVVGLGDYKTFSTRRIEQDSVGRWQELPERILAEMSPILNPVLERAGYEALEAKPDDSDAMRLHELAMMYRNNQ